MRRRRMRMRRKNENAEEEENEEDEDNEEEEDVEDAITEITSADIEMALRNTKNGKANGPIVCGGENGERGTSKSTGRSERTESS